MKTKIDTVHLVLRHKWYDMIDSGKKTEEYRAISTWRRRLGGNIKFVTFHRGYSSTTMTFEVQSINTGIGNPEWGAPKDKEVFIIKFGKRIN